MSRFLAVLAACVAASLGAQVARADADFTDPAGDGGGAPDVTDVSVFNDSANRVLFGAHIAGGKAMAADGEVAFVIDADKSRDTGTDGWDYLISLAGDKTWNLYSWDGTQWAEATATTAKSYFFGDVVLFAIDRSELGNTSSFDFYVEGNQFAGDEIVATDAAPDGDGVWSYATVTKTFGLAASPLVVVTKGGPRAGKPFVVGYSFGRTDSPEPVAGAKSTCVATVGVQRVAARVVQDGAVAACRVTLPTAAKGKLLKLTLRTSFGGKTVSRTSASRIR